MSFGESIEIGRDYREEPAEPWCRFSGSCYMRRIEYHKVFPAEDAEDLEPYMAGCPHDESKCRSAQNCLGRIKWYTETACLECGKPFDPPGYFCSDECMEKWYARPKTCPICGTEFTTRIALKATCSNECARKYERIKARKRRRGA